MAVPKNTPRSMIIVELRKELKRLEARINKLEHKVKMLQQVSRSSQRSDNEC